MFTSFVIVNIYESTVERKLLVIDDGVVAIYDLLEAFAATEDKLLGNVWRSATFGG